MENFSYISAFLLGLMGAVHCIGMCGGIVGALSMSGSVPVVPQQHFVLAYNLGRITSYTVAGALAGSLGAYAMDLVALHHAQLILKLLAALFMILLGLYLSGWWQVLTRLERVGTHLWRYIQPLGRNFLPVRSEAGAYMVGLVWGWLPCGLVYTALIYSLTAGGLVQGAGLMFSFGLGTLPLMLSMGFAGARLAKAVRDARVRALAGLMVIGFGLFMGYEALRGFIVL